VQQIQLQTTIPVIFGMLTVLNEEQAIARSTGENNHGYSWGKTAVEMALLRQAALSPKGPERVSSIIVVDILQL
jgi:6,7-dimethyl-8-ribityllumazine synthase